MPSKSQLRANRENASHSTGPTTPAGKATCSQNGLKHGLASSQPIIPGESEEAFNQMLAALLAEHQPATITETLLVQDMAKHHWLADRALRLQNYALELPPAPTLGVLIRYHTANARAFHKALAALTALRKTRLAEIGSASKKTAQAAKEAEAAMDAEQKQRHDEWLAAMIRDCQPPPTIEQMIADGFVQSPETGNWEKTIT